MSIEAKIPHEGDNWKTIDIYVFNNGQELFPPRKYHLESEELSWWNTTLKFLAKSQYGSLYSMVDLYTIKGEKIENPLRLSNGAAYVAVKSNDSFVNTGYERYLLKASRSWEKSQARRNGVEKKSDDNLNISMIYPINEINNTKRGPHEENCREQPKNESKNIFSEINDSLLLKDRMNTQRLNGKKRINSKRLTPPPRLIGKKTSVNNKNEPILTDDKRNSKCLVNKCQGKKNKLFKDLIKEKSILESPLHIPITIFVPTQNKTTSTTQLISISNKSLITDENVSKEQFHDKDNSDINNISKNHVMPNKNEPDQHQELLRDVTSIDNEDRKEGEDTNLNLSKNNLKVVHNTNSYTILTTVKENTSSREKPELNNSSKNKLIELKCATEISAHTEENFDSNLNALDRSTSKTDSKNMEMQILADHKSQFIFCEYTFDIPQNLKPCICNDNRRYIITCQRKVRPQRNLNQQQITKTLWTHNKLALIKTH